MVNSAHVIASARFSSARNTNYPLRNGAPRKAPDSGYPSARDRRQAIKRRPPGSNWPPVQVLPSLDLTQGRAVRLERGDLARQKPYANGAAEVIALARRLTGAGASRLHLVDLDAATGKGDNRRLVERLVAESPVEGQVAGGARSPADAGRWLEAGAAAVVMGTAAVRRPDLLAEVAAAHPGRVLAALGVRRGRPAGTCSAGGLTRRWREWW